MTSDRRNKAEGEAKMKTFTPTIIAVFKGLVVEALCEGEDIPEQTTFREYVTNLDDVAATTLIRRILDETARSIESEGDRGTLARRAT
jgi:hypothetical protein